MPSRSTRVSDRITGKVTATRHDYLVRELTGRFTRIAAHPFNTIIADTEIRTGIMLVLQLATRSEDTYKALSQLPVVRLQFDQVAEYYDVAGPDVFQPSGDLVSDMERLLAIYKKMYDTNPVKAVAYTAKVLALVTSMMFARESVSATESEELL